VTDSTIDPPTPLNPASPYIRITETISHTVLRFINDWTASKNVPASTFASLYAPTIQWYDHAFQIAVLSHAELTHLRRAWWNALPDFAFELESVTATPKGSNERLGRCVSTE
jgi:hypothetical protein